MIKLEIERKFLLKSMPSIVPCEKIVIEQYYWKNKKNIWERARTYHSDVSGDSYVHTVKKAISKGVCSEDEKIISLDEFNKFKNVCLKSKFSSFVIKERWVYKDGDLKWEVDKFGSGYTLIIAEIELPHKGFRIKIPKFIKEILMLEVTGLKRFSSRSLSKKINK